ncbi:hypothetical protein GV794_16995 [Nocardia cyriacigeorgica]|uniref:Uncharacterized protein n=1 Tax=Nocardia cyriacigeorgica TaxID=135487 RepID=A0A6P1DHL2_9NOCA|nr:hypothetical protein [Nocardia cyriacigeorgica]NEW39097.1 hypothetical protein [Nocardia cyriacigeorgica]NEW48063.1 hypothetical protein [Nocardia cyriacigeorgica]NEW52733.1 hypothetical protein [Nocardia cyriacigeorgica]NEW57339.1 hypothetical protein [Nocardia cyriacigeorgica]
MRIRSILRTSTGRYAALAIAATAALTGCSAVSGTALPGEPDLRGFDIGSYPTAPLDMRWEYMNSVPSGTELAVMRLSDNVINGIDVDPKLKYNRGVEGFNDSRAATKLLADVNGPVLDRHNFMFGIGLTSADTAKTADKSAGGTTITIGVLQFPDDKAAQAAARDLDQTDFAVAPDQNKPVELKKYPDAHSHWRPGIPTLGSTMAVGSYVITLLLTWPSPDLDSLTTLAEKTYATQVPMLKELSPLSKREVLELPFDPDSMLQRTLASEDFYFTPDAGKVGTYQPRGLLHWVGEPTDVQKAMQDNGVDRIALADETYLWRTRDADAAAQFADTRLTASRWTPIDAPKDVPDARCSEDADPNDPDQKYVCIVRYDRYVAQVQSGQPVDVRQRAAAQYALLANSQYQ